MIFLEIMNVIFIRGAEILHKVSQRYMITIITLYKRCVGLQKKSIVTGLKISFFKDEIWDETMLDF